MRNKKGFSLVELVVIIAVLAVLAAVLTPALMKYTEQSRAQKDFSTMDELVNAVNLALADDKCYDEVLQYSIDNNFITYTDSSGKYGQQLNDEEFWAPDGSGKATTITFNPEENVSGEMIYRLENALVNDMTYGNGSYAADRAIEGAQVENIQCYLGELTLLYNAMRSSIGDEISPASATYRNLSFTIFIKFSQKDGVKVADVEGMFNGTNLHVGCEAAKGSGTISYDEATKEPIQTEQNPGKVTASYDKSAMGGGGNVTNTGGGYFIPSYKLDVYGTIPEGAEYLCNVTYYLDDETCEWVYDADTVLGPGDKFPEHIEYGDCFRYGDYEYMYGYGYCTCASWTLACGCLEVFDGWGVRCTNDTKKPGNILCSINHEPITNADSCFWEFVELVYAPTIPSSVNSMIETFSSCQNLKTCPIIPDGVQHMDYAFYMCSALEKVNRIPKNVETMWQAFMGCTSLTGTITIDAQNIDCPLECGLFAETIKPITITGSSPHLLQLASTANNNNVTIAGQKSVIPIGGEYKTIDGQTYTEGDEFPTLKRGDIYVFGDYEYCYGYTWCDDSCWSMECGCDYLIDGWAVKCINNTEYPGALLKSINGERLVDMQWAFSGCDQMYYAPEIPETVTDISYAFASCKSLRDMPSIPDGVVWMDSTFYSCESLSSTSALPNTVQSMRSAFSNCVSLVTAPIIPSSVTDVGSLFNGCYKLRGTVTINSAKFFDHSAEDGKQESSIWAWDGCFRGTTRPITLTGTCTNLELLSITSSSDNITVISQKKIIPEGGVYVSADGITYRAGEYFPDTQPCDTYRYGDYEYYFGYTICDCFYQWSTVCGCDIETPGWGVRVLNNKKTEYGKIEIFVNGHPITSLNCAFAECHNLKETPEIPLTTQSMWKAFENDFALESAKGIPNKVIDMNHAFINCKSLTNAPSIPASVQDLSYAFYGCTSLRGSIRVDGSPTRYDGCLSDTQIQNVLGFASLAIRQDIYETKFQ